MKPQCCDVRYDCRIQIMFRSSLPLVVCRRAHALFTLFLFVAYSGVQHILSCVFVLFDLVLCLVYGGVQHILSCVFVLFVVVLCTQ
jgi:hypothetical protein